MILFIFPVATESEHAPVGIYSSGANDLMQVRDVHAIFSRSRGRARKFRKAHVLKALQKRWMKIENRN